MSNKYVPIASLLVSVGLIASTVPAFAATNTPPTRNNRPGMVNGGIRQGMKPEFIGTVSAINGSTITMTSKQGFGLGGFVGRNASSSPKTAPTITPTTVIYSINTTNSTVIKNNATSSVSNISVGDTLMVQGTLNGTNITATNIRDGIMNSLGRDNGANNRGDFASTTSLVEGNGQPVIAGTISTISGETLTISNKSNVSYSVDATNAKITQGPNNTVSISNLTVGDNVVVQGTINDTSVTASSIIDQTKPGAATSTPQKPRAGILGGIGQFFMHLFGF